MPADQFKMSSLLAFKRAIWMARVFFGNETSIRKPSEYLFDRRLYLYGKFEADRCWLVSPFFPCLLLTCGSTDRTRSAPSFKEKRTGYSHFI